MKSRSTSGDSCVKACPPDGELVYLSDWIEAREASALLLELASETNWQSRTIRMFGRELMQPRKIAFQGDPGIAYAYSGGLYRAECWHPGVERLRRALVTETGVEFNCALLNLYRDGSDSMGWHADDEPELGTNPTIASVSLGASRRFVLRQKHDTARKIELNPAHGSLIVMRGDIQHHWQHGLPKTKRPVGQRVNLTFRKIVRLPGSRRPA